MAAPAEAGADGDARAMAAPAQAGPDGAMAAPAQARADGAMAAPARAGADGDARAPAGLRDGSDEPHALCCPVTMLMLRDPVFVPESGSTYERSALETFWRAERSGGRPRDPLTNRELSSGRVYVNWGKRREVAAWLAENPGRVPAGWAGRDDVPPAQSVAEERRAAARAARPLARLLGALSLRTLVVALAVACALGLGLNLPRLVAPDPHWERAPPAAQPPGWAADPARAAHARQHAPPRASRLRVDELRGPAPAERALEARAPRRNLAELELSRLGGAAFTLGFTLSWTAGAHRARAPLPFVLFSTPFWLVGARLLRVALAPVLESSGLSLDWTGLTVRSELGLDAPGLGLRAQLRARRRRVPYARLRQVRLGRASDSESATLVLALEVGGDDDVLEWGEGLAEAELQWLCGLVRGFLEELAGAPGAGPELLELAARLSGGAERPRAGYCAPPPPVPGAPLAGAGLSASRGLHFHF